MEELAEQQVPVFRRRPHELVREEPPQLERVEPVEEPPVLLVEPLPAPVAVPQGQVRHHELPGAVRELEDLPRVLEEHGRLLGQPQEVTPHLRPCAFTPRPVF